MSVNLTTKLHLSNPVFVYLLHTKTVHVHFAYWILRSGVCGTTIFRHIIHNCIGSMWKLPKVCSCPLQSHGGKLGGSGKGSSRDDKDKPLAPDSEVGGERPVEITGLFGRVNEERPALRNESVRPVKDLDPDPTSVGETDVVPSSSQLTRVGETGLDAESVRLITGLATDSLLLMGVGGEVFGSAPASAEAASHTINFSSGTASVYA